MLTQINETREDLAKLFKGVGAEIGVEQGAYSEIICKQGNPQMLYCIDAWRAYRGYRDHTRQQKLDNYYEITLNKLEGLQCEIIRMFSSEAVDKFRDESLDFVYIDANHDYKHVTEDITIWAKKVKKGGIIAGHDYVRRKGQDALYAVVDAVDDYVKANNISELIIYKGDSPASWMFRKI